MGRNIEQVIRFGIRRQPPGSPKIAPLLQRVHLPTVSKTDGRRSVSRGDRNSASVSSKSSGAAAPALHCTQQRCEQLGAIRHCHRDHVAASDAKGSQHFCDRRDSGYKKIRTRQPAGPSSPQLARPVFPQREGRDHANRALVSGEWVEAWPRKNFRPSRRHLFQQPPLGFYDESGNESGEPCRQAKNQKHCGQRRSRYTVNPTKIGATMDATRSQTLAMLVANARIRVG